MGLTGSVFAQTVQIYEEDLKATSTEDMLFISALKKENDLEISLATCEAQRIYLNKKIYENKTKLFFRR